MSKIYLFDVDGTLTPAKSKINKKFSKQFLKWMKDKEVYIVSGGSFVRIIGQLNDNIVDRVSGVFACMGNIFHQKIETVNETGFSEWETVYENKFQLPRGLYGDLERIASESKFPIKAGKHHEERVGMVNFSIVGRSASPAQRKAYEEYDPIHREREMIVEELKMKYPKLDFAIGGAVSIDIFNIGNDKSQIIDRHFKEAIEYNQIIFVGDRIPFPGNDHALATALKQHPNGSAHEVESWQDTSELLKTEPFA